MKVIKFIGNQILRSLFMSSVLALSFHVVAGEITEEDKDNIQKVIQTYSQPDRMKEQTKKLMNLIAKADRSSRTYEKGQDTSSSLFREVAQTNQGNQKNLDAMIEKAKKDPEQFMDQLSPSQKSLIENFKHRLIEHQKKLQNIE